MSNLSFVPERLKSISKEGKKMKTILVFEGNAQKYDEWFDNYPLIYQSEIAALSRFVPPKGRGLEIGVGTGRFAKPFGIKEGVEPAGSMAELAEKRGITVYKAVAEELPFPENTFDYAAIVTTICFLQDPFKALQEARRVLRPGGILIIGLIDKNSKLGKSLAAKSEKSEFYKYVTFYAVEDILKWLNKLDFTSIQLYQTLFKSLGEITTVEPVKGGYGEGGFVAISGKKLSH